MSLRSYTHLIGRYWIECQMCDMMMLSELYTRMFTVFQVHLFFSTILYYYLLQIFFFLDEHSEHDEQLLAVSLF